MDEAMESVENSGGDAVDARGKGIFWKSKVENIPRVILPYSIDSEDYYMDYARRGKCLIFNNKTFDKNTGLNERKGTDVDAEDLYGCFRGFDFDAVVHNNLSQRDILSILKTASKEDHSKNDCFACCILTHGDQGFLYGRDGKFVTELLYENFSGDKCPSLAGKPKMFFIQACQGDKLDGGTWVCLEKSDSSPICKIPAQADFLIVYSSVPGYYSWRNTSQGSWFVQALCRVFKEYSKGKDLLQLMTIVSRIVAYEFESYVPDNDRMHLMKQVPFVTSTLTRKIYFPPKL